MEKNDFKRNIIFNLIKDRPLRSSKEFKEMCRKEYQYYDEVYELYKQVINYQIEKYGSVLNLNRSYEDSKKKYKNSLNRKYYRRGERK